MLVGDDIAVLGDDEAAAGGGGLHLLAEDVGGHGGAVDGYHAVHRGGVHLGGGHQGLAVHGFDADGRGGAAGFLDGGFAGLAGQGRAAETAQAAHQGTAQDQGRDLGAGLFPEALPVGLGNPGFILIIAGGAGGLILLRRLGLRPGSGLPAGLAGVRLAGLGSLVLGITVMIQVFIAVEAALVVLVVDAVIHNCEPPIVGRGGMWYHEVSCSAAAVVFLSMVYSIRGNLNWSFKKRQKF